jgi:methyl-accepting chemotaxis protein
MVIKIENAKRSYSTWMIVLRLGITAAFFIWFYIILNSTSDLNEKLSLVSAEYAAIDDLQIEFKDEIQEWKNLLLRSNSKDTLNKNWQIFDSQYQKVNKAAQDIIRENDIKAINERIQTFVAAHKANYELYKKSVDILVKNGFNPHQADAAVNGIDRPLFDYLEAADLSMQSEKKIINENLTAKSRKQIEQSILSLVFLVLLAVWMPK